MYNDDMDVDYFAMLEAAGAAGARDVAPAPMPAQDPTDTASPPRSPSTATGAVLEGSLPCFHVEVGDRVKHTAHGYYAHVLHLGTASSAPWHQGKICIQYQKAVNKSKTETVQRWCIPSDLQLLKGSPRKSPRLEEAPASASVSAERPGIDTQGDRRARRGSWRLGL